MDVTVNITDTAYVEKTVEILPGDTVTWLNVGAQSHTMVGDNNSFTSGPLMPGARFSQKFTQQGFYPYHDTVLGSAGGGGMSGVVRVVQQTPTPVVSTPTPTTQTVTPNVTASAQTLYAQVLQLQQVLAALQAKAVSGGGTVVQNTPTYTTNAGATGACPRIGRVLKPGMSGDDVLRLQQFLAADPSVYPDASATGYFGALTQAAVQRWQIKYNIVSTGDPETTGFGIVGPRTAAAISLQCSNATGSGTSTGGGAAEVGGFIQVTPSSGNAPLVVSVQATVNTVNSCQSALYVLEWGDDTAAQGIPVSASICAPLQQTYSHTYQYGGQYTIKLLAGGHQSTATVTVVGPARPGTPEAAGKLSITSPVAGQNYAAGQAMNIAWQSASLPAGASIVFDLYTGAGEKVTESDVIAISSYASGSFSWTVPIPGGVCPAIYPGKLCGVTIPTGSYRIVAKAYAASTAGNTFGEQIADAGSGIFTIIASNTGGGQLTDTFTANTVAGSAPLTVNFAGRVTSANKAWCEGGCFNLLQFGDGASDYIALPTTAGASLGYSLSHIYASAGTYIAKLFQSFDTSGSVVGSPITITVGGGASNFNYGPLEIGPGDGNSPRSFAATFDLPSTCTGYTLNWGDGSALVSQTHSSACAQTSVIKTHMHTYAQSGSYTVALSRGATLSQKDSVAIGVSDTDQPGSGNSCPVYQILGCPVGQSPVYGAPTYDGNGCEQPNYYCAID